MTEKENLDFSEEKQYTVFERYEPLLCDDCKKKLRLRMIPIKKALDNKRPPSVRALVRLQNSLCGRCLPKVAAEKQKEEAGL